MQRETHAPLKRNTSFLHRGSKSPTSDEPGNVQIERPLATQQDSSRILKEYLHSCVHLHASHAAASVHIKHESADIASEWHLNLDKDPHVGEHHTSPLCRAEISARNRHPVTISNPHHRKHVPVLRPCGPRLGNLDDSPNACAWASAQRFLVQLGLGKIANSNTPTIEAYA